MEFFFVLLGLLWLLAAAHELHAVTTLRALPPLPPDSARRAVTVVMAVRDDAAHIAESVRRLLAQQHVDLRIVVVDDRSTDATSDILAQLCTTDARLTVVTVATLPADWLGKSHALHRGAAEVQAPWLLFTDGDAQMSPSVIARAIDAAERAAVDHVALLPTHRNPSWPGIACLLAFQLVIFRRVRAVNRETQRSFVGTGAFNLVRTAAYRHVGGHEPLRLEVVDDVFLGQLLFAAGFRSRVWFAAQDLAIDWGGTPRQLLRVVEKNMFAMLRYRTVLSLALCGIAAGLLGTTFAAPWLSGPAGWFAIGAYWLTAAPALALARRMAWPKTAALLTPLARLWLPIALLNSTIVTLWQGGVRWRGTFYPLAQLRRGQVPVR